MTEYPVEWPTNRTESQLIIKPASIFFSFLFLLLLLLLLHLLFLLPLSDTTVTSSLFQEPIGLGVSAGCCR